jgi:5-methylcytosine-specific restriction enzyme subunit McrC
MELEAGAARRTIVLKERRPRECRLSAAEVAFLLAGHRAHVTVEPTGHRGRYRLTATGHVGTIAGPTCRWVIRPKVPVASLCHLLAPTDPVPESEDRVRAVPRTKVLDFLTGRLARLMAERATAGLHRAYTERAGHGPFLQGRLDLAAHLRETPGHKDRFHCRYEEFSADVPCNQMARATAELVLRSPLAGEGAKATLRQALEGFAGVSSVPLDDGLFRKAGPTRLTEAYGPLLDLCRLLADGLTAGTDAGPTPCPAFLLDMERVFERYVTAGVVRAFTSAGRYTVSVQPLHIANRAVPGQPDLLMRPDVMVDREGLPALVIDAKWKSLPGSPLVTDDVYQVLAYCVALGVGRAVLVYPGRRDRVWQYDLARTQVAVEIRTLRVTGSGRACARSLRRLGLALRRAAAGR